MKRPTPQEAHRNKALMFAVMLEKGPIVDKAGGKATAVLYRYMRLNGYTAESQSSLNSMMALFPHCFERETKGKRTYKIDLVEIPTEFDVMVDNIRGGLVWEGEVPTPTPTPTPAPTPAPAPEVPVAAPVVPPAPVEVPTAAAIADQVLHLLVERLTLKPVLDETPDADAPRLLIAANEAKRKLQVAYDKLRSDYDRSEAANARLKEKVATLERNVQIMSEQAARGVGHEIGKGLDRVMRQAPGSNKGCDVHD